MSLSRAERRVARERLGDGVVRRLSVRARAEIVLIIGAIVLLAIANGELAAARAGLEGARSSAAESSAQIERIVDEIQGTIIEILAPAESPQSPLP
jgi:hypothetical protein